MLRTIFALAVAGLIAAAVSGTSQAAPIAPLAAGVTAPHSGNLTRCGGIVATAGSAATATGTACGDDAALLTRSSHTDFA